MQLWTSLTEKISAKLFNLSSFFGANNLDDRFLESYRKLIFNQYASLTNAVKNPEAKAEADRIIKLNPNDVDWDDIYQLELAIIKLEPLDSLRGRIWILRNEYKELASTDELKDYIASKPPDPNDQKTTESDLRADAVHLQEEMNWHYVVMWIFETFRGQIIQVLFFSALCLLLFTCFTIIFWVKLYGWFAAIDLNLPLIAMTVIPGIIGGIISTLRRVQKARLSGNADIDLSELQEAKTGIYLSPLLGGIFALLLFFLFAGGFMAGGLFPKLTFDVLIPSEGAVLDYTEVSKLIVWSFIAGFAEKFVPDRLERLTQENGRGGKPPSGGRGN